MLTPAVRPPIHLKLSDNMLKTQWQNQPLQSEDEQASSSIYLSSMTLVSRLDLSRIHSTTTFLQGPT